MSLSTKPLLKEKWDAIDIDDQSGKVFIITGANSGLGFEASLQIAKKNATVIMACRNEEKGQEAVKSIKNQFPNAHLDLFALDLSSFASIKAFTESFLAKYDRLDVLINNAGIMQPPRKETAEGFELQIGVNHFGPYLLTGLLLPLLKETKESRIILQSSIAAARGSINFEDLNSEKSYSRTGAYSQSKLANILFAFELNRKLTEGNLNTIAVAVHPGYTATNLQQNGPRVGGRSSLSLVYSFTNRLVAQHVTKGSLPMLYASTAPDVHGGDYIGPKSATGLRGFPKRIKAPKNAYVKEDMQKLWKISEEATGFTYHFS